MIYITGDTHGDFKRIVELCERENTSKDDIVIILGDAGINYLGPEKDKHKKELLQSLPITIFAIHGNHEMRPGKIPTYQMKTWNEGIVYYEEEYPDILFARDGEIFNLNGFKTVVIGGAYSIDKDIRLLYGYGWWPDEQPSESIKSYVEYRLEKVDWEVDVVLTHTVPVKYEPTEVFLSGIDQSTVDKSTEMWLDGIEHRLDYKRWYAGHYHTSKEVDNLKLMFLDIAEFGC